MNFAAAMDDAGTAVRCLTRGNSPHSLPPCGGGLEWGDAHGRTAGQQCLSSQQDGCESSSPMQNFGSGIDYDEDKSTVIVSGDRLPLVHTSSIFYASNVGLSSKLTAASTQIRKRRTWFAKHGLKRNASKSFGSGMTTFSKIQTLCWKQSGPVFLTSPLPDPPPQGGREY
jgi:hypothetical protein